MLKYLVLGLLGAIVALGVYVRLAPSSPSVWHKTFPPQSPGQRQLAGGYQIVLKAAAPEATLVALDALIMATPRTTRLAGAPAEGMTTYITRSRVFGFPDYTTVWAGPDDTDEGGHGPLLKIEGRLRFGKSDMGVNRARIEGWLTQLSEAQT
ncbi:MAG TPA: DUF1499 domain-containing protein [Octadecabacter sp.]|nr:DUF1499 domain-containing protein [Octadecabacter sp.]